MAYDVGSRNEKPGKTGFAHLFEHLMYKGSQNVADGELAALIQNYGGDHNGQTDKDHTIYFEEVPANQLDMVLFLEADRMKALALTKENLANQLEAVKEERRFRVDNQPYGKTSELLDDMAFENFVEQAFGDRIDGGSGHRVARRLHRVLQRPITRRTTPSCRSRATSIRRPRWRKPGNISAPSRPARRRRSWTAASRRRRERSGRRSRIRWRGSC